MRRPPVLGIRPSPQCRGAQSCIRIVRCAAVLRCSRVNSPRRRTAFGKPIRAIRLATCRRSGYAVTEPDQDEGEIGERLDGERAGIAPDGACGAGGSETGGPW